MRDNGTSDGMDGGHALHGLTSLLTLKDDVSVEDYKAQNEREDLLTL